MKSIHDAVNLLRNIRCIVFDFDGVFTDNNVYTDEDGKEMVRCNRSDGLRLGEMKELGYEMIIVSTEVNQVVSKRGEKLKIPVYQGISDKMDFLTEWLTSKDFTLKEVAFVGNDMNDICVLDGVGLPIVVADFNSSLSQKDYYVTDCRGGAGAVREVCEALLHSKRNWT